MPWSWFVVHDEISLKLPNICKKDRDAYEFLINYQGKTFVKALAFMPKCIIGLALCIDHAHIISIVLLYKPIPGPTRSAGSSGIKDSSPRQRNRLVITIPMITHKTTNLPMLREFAKMNR
jgi:hypothetical protein